MTKQKNKTTRTQYDTNKADMDGLDDEIAKEQRILAISAAVRGPSRNRKEKHLKEMLKAILGPPKNPKEKRLAKWAKLSK